MTCELFECPKHAGHLRLTAASCANNWKRAKKAEPWEALRVCRGCDIGALNAGEAPPPPAPAERECLRCGDSARRLVGKQLCPSCYNRQRELLTGRYRRLVPPQGLRIQRVLVHVVGQAAPLAVQVASAVEALRVAASRQPGAALLAVASPVLPWTALCRKPQTSFLPGA